MVTHVTDDPQSVARMRAKLPADDPYAMSQPKGTARCPGPSVQDILALDKEGVPDFYLQEAYEFLGDEDIPFEAYTSREVFDREMQQMWPRVWQWACREEQIPNPGDFIVYEIGAYSFILVRTPSRQIRAYYNSCLHRGTKLRHSDAEGTATELRCPYHGWSWNLEGELQRVPCPWDFPHVSGEKFRLPQVKVDTWGGFVFINMDEHARPLREYLEVLPEHLKTWQMEKNVISYYVKKELGCNWKAAIEAFMESYHVMETHPQLMNSGTDANCQYDIFGEHVSRFLSPHGAQSPYMDPPLSEEQLLDSMLLPDPSLVGGQLKKLPEGETVRSISGRVLRKSMEDSLKIDLSHLSVSEIIDMAEYSLFPNMMVFTGMQLPMAYRFRPIGSDPNRSLFELFLFRRLADGETLPAAPEAHLLTEKQSFTEAPGMDPYLGNVYDQDTINLRAQQEGFAAAKKSGQTLGNYQEIRLRRFHRTLQKYLHSR